jgi:hypothetical protein
MSITQFNNTKRVNTHHLEQGIRSLAWLRDCKP